jgi:hypothetical protein
MRIAYARVQSRRGLRRDLNERRHMNSTIATLETQLPSTFDQDSWDRWMARGRAHDLAFRQKVQVLALVAVTAIALGATFWLF